MDELTSLALAARNGDRVSLNMFIRRTQPDVWRVCNHLGPRNSADDLTQDVYMKMVKALPNFKGESSARTWLLSIARFTAIDALRARKRRDRVRHLLHDDEVIDLRSSIEVDEMLSCLDQDQRAAFVMTQLMGLSYEDASRACDCAVGTIRSRVARARTKLMANLEEQTA